MHCVIHLQMNTTDSGRVTKRGRLEKRSSAGGICSSALNGASNLTRSGRQIAQKTSDGVDCSARKAADNTDYSIRVLSHSVPSTNNRCNAQLARYADCHLVGARQRRILQK